MWLQKSWYFKNYVFWVSIAKDLWYINLPNVGRHYLYVSVSSKDYFESKAFAIHIFQLKIAFLKLK